jgi:hypothetical protein
MNKGQQRSTRLGKRCSGKWENVCSGSGWEMLREGTVAAKLQLPCFDSRLNAK